MIATLLVFITFFVALFSAPALLSMLFRVALGRRW